MKVNFTNIDNTHILEYIRKNDIRDLSQDMILFCNGSLGKILKIKDNKDNYLKIEELINKLDTTDLIYILNHSEVLYKAKEEIWDLLEYINILLIKTKQIRKINCIKYVEEAKKRLSTNSNYDMTIDNLLIKMWEEINEEYNRC